MSLYEWLPEIVCGAFLLGFIFGRLVRIVK